MAAAATVTAETLHVLAAQRSATQGTSLITRFIPAHMNLALVTSQLQKEQALSVNIKAKAVRHDVLAALKAAVFQLRTWGPTAPAHGLIMYAGRCGL
jgi:peptide subunit release factor 1 (eRF1)